MTTFKNNAKYAELLYTFLDVAIREDTPLTVPEVLTKFEWRFKGGSLFDAAAGTRLCPCVSSDFYPDGLASEIAAQWPDGKQAVALRRILINRRQSGRLRNRGVLGRLGSYLVMTADYGLSHSSPRLYSGMHAIYHIFGIVWDWAARAAPDETFDLLSDYTKELLLGASACGKVHLPTAEENRRRYWALLQESRVPGLLIAIQQAKELIRLAHSRQAVGVSRSVGRDEKDTWGIEMVAGLFSGKKLTGLQSGARSLKTRLGPCVLRVAQECALLGSGEVRHALAKTDMERLHQLLMSATSALVGVVSQAAVGTLAQRSKAKLAVHVAERNIQRIVDSSRKVPLGDEVLVCKGYRRAYTAHLGWLAGPLCLDETRVLVAEAIETAGPGVLDVEGMLADARTLDAASALNASKMFKICPAPDVSPGLAMMDRIKQIGNGNTMDPNIRQAFTDELRTQILRAFIRVYPGRLKLRTVTKVPLWNTQYLKGEFDEVPSAEIHTFLAWEGKGTMPDISPHDPTHWKDSGLGADTIWESRHTPNLGRKSNMLTRLVFDDDCPMPGRLVLNDEHVIKFFVKAEGHKDPARGIFSANLADRQAQSWMEKAVESVARKHPSYMIGQEVDVKEARVMELVARPVLADRVALYYSFDISGWSARMPAEPQRISHKIWAELFGGHLFDRATRINEGAHIYLALDGYVGWYENTHSNLEGFNGKEMTMILIALLSLSVRRWRTAVATAGILTTDEAMEVSALLFAYIDDGLSRIDLPRRHAVAAFQVYKNTVIETFAMCGFTVEVSKCFPSDRFAIFLNEVYLAGRHVVHGVRAAMAISSEPTERHTTLVERITSVTTGVRGAVMAGLNPLSGVCLMAYHSLLHLLEWTAERDPVILTIWSLTPRSWGGLGMPNILQIYVSGSGAAFEEGVATLQAYARINHTAKKVFTTLCKTELEDRTCTGVLTAPLSGKVKTGYMIDSRVASAIRKALRELMDDGRLSRYAMRLLKYSDNEGFNSYSEAVIPLGTRDVLQEQMIDNIAESHPHCIFSAFARRLEKSMTVKTIVGRELFISMIEQNRLEAMDSVAVTRRRALV